MGNITIQKTRLPHESGNVNGDSYSSECPETITITDITCPETLTETITDVTCPETFIEMLTEKMLTETLTEALLENVVKNFSLVFVVRYGTNQRIRLEFVFAQCHALLKVNLHL